MQYNRQRMPVSGLMILSGGILLAIATLFHPPLLDPWNTVFAFEQVSESKHWMWDHSLMLLAMALWLLGLAGAESRFSDYEADNSAHPANQNHDRAAIARNAARLFVGALILWVLILTVELAGIPPLVEGLEDNIHSEPLDTSVSDPLHSLGVVWQSTFAVGLMSGYLAMALVWLGVMYLAQCMRHDIRFSRRFALWGRLSGLAGVLATPVMLLFPRTAPVWLILTAFPAYSWTLFLGFKFWRGKFAETQ